MMAVGGSYSRDSLAGGPFDKWILMLAVATLWTVVLGPFIIYGGFICDDWMVVAHAAAHPTWRENFRSWFPLFAARPLAPVVLATTSTLLPASPTAYIVCHLGLLTVALALISVIWKRLLGTVAAICFFILAAFPSMASTLIFSPGMQQLASAAYLLWAASLYLTVTAAEAKTCRWRGTLAVASSTLLLLGLLLYEIFLPLLLIQFVVPKALRNTRVSRDGAKPQLPPPRMFERPDLAWAAMIGVPVVTAAILQKWVFPAFAPDMSRLQIGGPGMWIRAAAYWIGAVLMQLPVLWADALWRLAEAWDWLTAGIALAMLLVVIRCHRGTTDCDHPASLYPKGSRETARVRLTDPVGLGTDARAILWLRRACWVAAGSSIALFILSQSYAAVYGYDNRKLSSFWIACALALSAYLGRKPQAISPGRLRLGWAVFLGVFFLNTTSFLLQRNNYVESWQVQQTILDDLAASLPKDHAARRTVLAIVPPVVPANHNDECVFTRPWDIGNAARLRTGGLIMDAAPIYPWLLRQGRVRFDTEKVIIDELWSASYGNMWLFSWTCLEKRTGQLGHSLLGIPVFRAYGRAKPGAAAVWIPIESRKRLKDELENAFRRDVGWIEMSKPAQLTQNVAEWFRCRVVGKPDHRP